MPKSLSDFLETLAADRELIRVGADVDPQHELAEIIRRSAEAGSPALLFDRVTGSKTPLVANLLATPERACRALGIGRLDELALRTESILRQQVNQGWLDRLRSGPENNLERLRPKLVRSGAAQQIVRLGRDIDLTKLALVRGWPDETGPSITAALLVATDPAGVRRVFPVRLVLAEKPAGPATQLAVVDDGGGDWTRLWQAALARGERIPAAVVLGGDPAWRVAAHAAVAHTLAGGGLDGFEWLATVCGAPLEVVKCRTQPLEVPAEADMILEAVVDPAACASVVLASAAGPYYRAPHEAPLLTVETITERSGCLLPVAVGGAETGEARVLGKAAERLMLPVVKAAISELVDYSLPVGDDRFAFLAIRKSIPLGARRAASAFWGVPAVATTKFVVVVDEEVDVQQPAEVWRRVGANVDPSRDVFSHEGPGAVADHAFDRPFVAQQLGIDATRKLPGERALAGPAALTAGREVAEMVERRWQEYGLPARMK